MLIWQKWTTTNNKIEQIKENEDDTEDIYDGDIYYDGGVDQEELYGILEETYRNTNFHQEKDKENYEDSEEEDYTQDMNMDPP